MKFRLTVKRRRKTKIIKYRRDFKAERGIWRGWQIRD